MMPALVGDGRTTFEVVTELEKLALDNRFTSCRQPVSYYRITMRLSDSASESSASNPLAQIFTCN